MFSPYGKQICAFLNLGGKCSPQNDRFTQEDNYPLNIICEYHYHLIFNLKKKTSTEELTNSTRIKRHAVYLTKPGTNSLFIFPYEPIDRADPRRGFCLNENIMEQQVSEQTDCMPISVNDKKKIRTILLGMLSNSTLIYAGDDYYDRDNLACYQGTFQQFFSRPEVLTSLNNRFRNSYVYVLYNENYYPVLKTKLPWLYQLLILFMEDSFHEYSDGIEYSLPYNITFNMNTHKIEKVTRPGFELAIYKEDTDIATPLILHGRKIHTDTTSENITLFAPHHFDVTRHVMNNAFLPCNFYNNNNNNNAQ